MAIGRIGCMSASDLKHWTMRGASEESCDFLFAYPSRSFGGVCQGCQHHLGIGYVLAYGGYRPEQARLYLADNRRSWEEMAERMCALAGKGIGFSVYESNYPFLSNLATRIRRRRPDLLIACGGPCATFSAQRILQDNAAFDLCILGEAELTFKALFDAGFSRDAWPEISGLAFRDNGAYRETGYREPYRSGDCVQAALDGLPSPYIAGLVPPEAAPALGVSTSRGCPNSCTFCSFTAIGRRTIRFFSESRVLEELRLICRHFEGTGQPVVIGFNDDNFTVQIGRAKRILAGLQQFRPENVSFSVMSRPDDARDSEFLELARAAGVAEIGFGLESAVPEVLSLVKKVRSRRNDDLRAERDYIKTTRKAVEASVSHGIRATVSIILGLPGDTMPRAKETLTFVRSLPVSTYFHNILHIYDGTELAWTHGEFGLSRVTDERSPFPQTQHSYDVTSLPIMSHEARTRQYLEKSMLSAVLGLTGLMVCLRVSEHPRIYLDVDSDVEPANWEQRPIGTLFITMPSVGRKETWRTRCFGSESLELTESGCYLSPEVFGRSDILPAFVLPGLGGQRSDSVPSCLEFVEMSPTDEVPSSQRNHWRLPYAACGLLPAECPVRTGWLASQYAERGTCVFYPESTDAGYQPPCEQCAVRRTCPRCGYLLRRYGVAYCHYQRSEKPQSLLAYLKAVVHVLRDPNTALDALPAIRLEEFPLERQDVRVISIDEKLFLFGLQDVQVG